MHTLSTQNYLAPTDIVHQYLVIHYFSTILNYNLLNQFRGIDIPNIM
jgi:hypothetical protein